MINLCRIKKNRKLSAQLHFQKTDVTVCPLLQIQRPGLATRIEKAHRRPHYDCRRFFCARIPILWWLCVGDLRVCRVPFPRFANLRTAATLIRLATISGSSYTEKELHLMHALNPSKIRAAAHRAMALAALHANSSLATRLARYNAHMSKARALEAAGGAQ
ncbi:MAG: hypothetical protein RR726_23965 [Pseudomonas sp.]